MAFLPTSHHVVTRICDIAQAPTASDIWTVGYVSKCVLSEAFVVLEHEKNSVTVSVRAIDSSNCRRGDLFMCLGSLESNGILTAKILKSCPGLDVDRFFSAVARYKATDP